jgi:hypothetical protein
MPTFILSLGWTDQGIRSTVKWSRRSNGRSRGSIDFTSSARESTDAGTSRPRALAVL